MEINYFACSVCKPGEDYCQENFDRIVSKSSFVLHEDTKQKGAYEQIKTGDLLLLKYNNFFVAYGTVTRKHTSKEEYWNLCADVKSWIFFDTNNKDKGIPAAGIQDNTIAGGQFGTVKQLNAEFALGCINQINSKAVANIAMEENNLNITKTTIMADELNTILFGPPGTGKTYNSVNNALAIVENDKYIGIINSNSDDDEKRKLLVKEFSSLLVKAKNDDEWKTEKGQIAFCTFHQSFSYEDFIEGIKPYTEIGNDTVKYRVEPGLFKRMAKLAEENQTEDADANIEITTNTKFFRFKITDPQLKTFIDDGYIAYSSADINKDKSLSLSLDGCKETINDNIILLTTDNISICAIGKPSGPIDKFSDELVKGRTVNWLNKKTEIKFSDIYSDDLQKSLGESLSRNHVKLEDFKIKLSDEKTERKYVIIIDEINRGNISQIFGELITLIESDKRKGKLNHLSVTLPYSKDLFSIPSNLYIIGTMNTADRSVEALDTALRRRFSFIEMMPKYEAIVPKSIKINNINFNLAEDILQPINNRIEKLIGRDHQIGHSYFIGIESEDKLKDVFKNKLIPLLQEYFYGDYAKMCLVIGNGFVSINKEKSDEKNKSFFADDIHEAIDDFMEKKVWELVNINEMSSIAFEKALTILSKGVKKS